MCPKRRFLNLSFDPFPTDDHLGRARRALQDWQTVVEKRNILITGARAPVALHMLRLLKGAGHRVLLADHLARPLAAASTLHDGYHRLPSFVDAPEAAARALGALLANRAIDLVVPTCEEVLHLAAFWQAHAPEAVLFAPDLEKLEQVHDKARFIALCADLGLEVPETRHLTSRDDLKPLRARARDLVLKPVWSRFGERALIRPEPRQLDRVAPTTRTPWVAQDFVPGEEVSAYAVARKGRITALSAYTALARAGRGAAVSFQPVPTGDIRPSVEAIVDATEWTGQISLDLIRRPDGALVPIECNPRATSGLHFFRDGPAFAAALLGPGTPAEPDVVTPQGVRLALWVYGAAQVLRGGNLRSVEDVLDWPGDPVGLGAQLRALAEFGGIALRHRTSLLHATTRDIEWNGCP